MLKFDQKQSGLSTIEVILAAAIFLIFATSSATVVLQGYGSNRLGSEETIANQFASEGIEAVRSIKNQGFSNLTSTSCSTGTGLTQSGFSTWSFSGSNNTLQKYTRVINVCDVQRDGSGNIVSSGGTVDPLTKKVTSTVTWSFGPTRNDSVVLTTYLTDWRRTKGGMIVYSFGGTSSNSLFYETLDGSSWTWSIAQSVPTDTGNISAAPRAVKLYSSSTRNEKILVSRHYNGTTQTIYATVWNGTSWGTPLSLASWNATTFLDVQNFDGDYLNNGDFIVMYSDNTTIPKYRVWNGSTWTSQLSIASLGTSGIPLYIVLKARPGTNEAIAAMFDSGKTTSDQYYNGNGYVSTNWSTIVKHSGNAPNNTDRYVDFAWSPNNPLIGGLAYSNSNTDKFVHIKIFTANGLGGGTWSSAAASPTVQTGNTGPMAISARFGANEFMICDKDTSSVNLLCYKSDFTPTVTNPINNLIASTQVSGIQRSYHISYGGQTGTNGLIVYSDNTATPKYKIYTASTSTFAVSASSISTSPYTLGTVETVRLIPSPVDDDIMTLVADSNFDFYSVVWNGTTNSFYTTPAGRAFSQDGLNGSAITDFWYDFAWDKF